MYKCTYNTYIGYNVNKSCLQNIVDFDCRDAKEFLRGEKAIRRRRGKRKNHWPGTGLASLLVACLTSLSSAVKSASLTLLRYTRMASMLICKEKRNQNKERYNKKKMLRRREKKNLWKRRSCLSDKKVGFKKEPIIKFIHFFLFTCVQHCAEPFFSLIYPSYSPTYGFVITRRKKTFLSQSTSIQSKKP